MTCVASDTEIQEIRHELAEIRALIPPKWTQWGMALIVSSFAAWSSWITVCVIRLEGARDMNTTAIMEHRMLPAHNGMQDKLATIQREVLEIKADLRVIAAEIKKQ